MCHLSDTQEPNQPFESHLGRSSDGSAPGIGQKFPVQPETVGGVVDKRLLFLGGARSWFADVEHALLELRPIWSARHIVDPNQAPSFVTASHCDAVIIHKDVAEPSRLLAQLREQFPHILCFSLKDDLNQGGSATTYDTQLGASMESVEAAENVVRAVLVHEWTSQPSVRELLAMIKRLPTLPRLHAQVTRELQSPNGSLEVVSQFVRKDPVMAAKFLQVINSAGFGMAYTVADPGEAVMFLGSVRTRALILVAGVFSQFDELKCSSFSPEQMWQHSLQVASLAQGITLAQTEDPRLAEVAFTAGLLHDIGKLVLAGNVPEMYATAHKLQQIKRIHESEAETTILNTTHSRLGACLLGAWRLPLPIVEAVAWHHSPSQSCDTGFSVLTAVHAGNVLAHETAGSNAGIGLPSRFDVFYLANLGLATRRNAWREACGMPLKDEEITFEDSIRRRLEAKSN
jgi:putative nucleotidyltransferase with HDIG domain